MPHCWPALSPISKLHPERSKAKYASARPDWYVPLGDIPFEVSQANRGLSKRRRSTA